MSTWQEATAPDGRTYFFNTETKETSWTNPDMERRKSEADQMPPPALSALLAEEPGSEGGQLLSPEAATGTTNQKIMRMKSESSLKDAENPALGDDVLADAGGDAASSADLDAGADPALGRIFEFLSSPFPFLILVSPFPPSLRSARAFLLLADAAVWTFKLRASTRS
jgi:WW domain